ncbi:MAG TPA: S-methyl-5-thioribose-1-phosphate isomerase [Actinomycetota bacterium]|nr:S-methyl-5-thioribose-1-phosphate isomerase [Actinomycetota bacterium]
MLAPRRTAWGGILKRVEELLPALHWRGDHLEVVDQTLLPGRVELRRLSTVAAVVDAIRRLVVRGAPALGVCAAYGVVVGLDEHPSDDVAATRATLERVAAEIGGARPTAVNLSAAASRVAASARAGTTPAEVRALALAEADAIRAEDEEACRRIGEHGRTELAAARRIMTHCNTGRLATAGLGTALGVVYAKALAGEPVEVVASETRPLLQGARLTAWELVDAGIPVTVVADPAAGAALATRRVDAVVVGCDRVALNGDTANKIGTYGLAVLARAHDVPFYVAGPLSSFDPSARSAADIVIEQRPADEVRTAGGAVVAPDVDVWNPAFDVTPGELITAFVTDAGVLRPPYDATIPAALEGAGAARA